VSLAVCGLAGVVVAVVTLVRRVLVNRAQQFEADFADFTNVLENVCTTAVCDNNPCVS
jgi:hypothetical protein